MKTLVSRYDKKMIAQLPKVLFQGRIIVIQSKSEAKKAVDYLMTQEMVGVDTETKPIFKKGTGMNPVALLQISTHDTCFLFRLNQIGFTSDLIKLMSDDSVLKIGLSLKDDFMQLKRRKPFTPGRYAELQSMIKDLGISDQSLQKIYANLFGYRISKTQQLTNWEADVLTEAQKRYAATDAWVCIHIYEEILKLNATGYMLEVIPEPAPPAPPPLTPEQIREKEEKKRQKEKERRKRKRQREKEQKAKNKNRANKEKIKSIKEIV